MSGIKIEFSGVTFNTGTADSDGNTWSLDIISGWWDGPEIDDELLPTIGRGSARGRVMERHRTIACRGVIAADSETAHDKAHLTLESLVPLYSDTAFVVYERTGAKQAQVHGKPPLVRCHGRAIEFTLILTSLSPDKTAYTTPSP